MDITKITQFVNFPIGNKKETEKVKNKCNDEDGSKCTRCWMSIAETKERVWKIVIDFQ